MYIEKPLATTVDPRFYKEHYLAVKEPSDINSRVDPEVNGKHHIKRRNPLLIVVVER